MKSLLIFLSLLSVNTYAQSKQSSVISDTVRGKCYRDINYFTLEGINELTSDKQNQYPYFEIVEVNSTKKYMYYRLSNKVSYYNVYERENNYWFTLDERREVLGHSYLYTYILRDRVLILEYEYDDKIKGGEGYIHENLFDKHDFKQSDHFLFSITLLTSQKSTKYTYYHASKKQKLRLQPSPELESKVNDLRYFKIIQTIRTIDGNILIEESKQIYPKNSSALYNKFCFNLVDEWGYKHNTFWPIFFTPNQLECK